MKVRSRFLLLAVPVIALSGLALAQAAQPTVSFHRQIKPILQKRCQGCHQPAVQGGKLVLTTYEAFRAGGASGPGFKPGSPQDSVVMKFITGDPPAMPKNQKPLTAAETELFRRWIQEGAKDDTPKLTDPISPENPPVYREPPVISAIAWSPDGALLAVSGYRETLIHRADGSGLSARFVGRSPRIESLAFSPDGRRLAVVGGAPALFGEAQLWRLDTGKQEKAAVLSYDVLYGASFSPEGDRLAVGGADNAVRILSVPNLEPLVRIDNHSDWVFATGWTMPDVKRIAAETERYAQGNQNRPLIPEETMHLLSTGRDRAIKLSVAKNGSFVDDINTHTSPYRAMALRPKSDQTLAAGDDGVPRLYQIYRTKPRTMNQEDQSLVRAFEAMPGAINACAFLPDGTRFVVGGENGEARIYAVDDGRKLAALRCGTGAVFALACRPDGEEIAAGGFDGRVRIFHASSGALIREFIPAPLGRSIGKTAANQRSGRILK